MTLGSLFSGIGGFDLAARWAGIETIWQVEKDKYCQKILKRHFPKVQLYGDIHTIGHLPTPDILTGGFPCQPFSTAGLRRGKDDDRALWSEMLRIIQESQPTWVCGENVPGIVNMELDNVLADLENAGYEAQTLIIPACSVGAPHIRQRVFIIAHTNSQSGKSIKLLCSGKEQEVISRVHDALRANTDHTPPPRQRKDSRKSNSITKTERLSVSYSPEWWSTEPGVGRVADGISHRMDRLRGLGNAIVPQVAYQLFVMIREINNAI